MRVYEEMKKHEYIVGGGIGSVDGYGWCAGLWGGGKVMGNTGPCDYYATGLISGTLEAVFYSVKSRRLERCA